MIKIQYQFSTQNELDLGRVLAFLNWQIVTGGLLLLPSPLSWLEGSVLLLRAQSLPFFSLYYTSSEAQSSRSGNLWWVCVPWLVHSRRSKKNLESNWLLISFSCFLAHCGFFLRIIKFFSAMTHTNRKIDKLFCQQ